jgi:septum formation protein
MLVLASTSPRRADLLRRAGIEFEVRPSTLVEWPYTGGPPAAHAEALARAKAGAVIGDGRPVVGADTIVVLDGAVLGKPADSVEAAAMLRRLSGREHRVVTAVAVQRAGMIRSGHASTVIRLRDLSEHEIEEYVASGEPLDKAGAYAYQGQAAKWVIAVEGDTDTVIGLPLRVLRDLLAE